MDNKKIGEFITLTRRQKNLTQKEMADILGITDKAISKWERGAGYPDISLLKPLSDILGVTVTELLEGGPNSEQRSEDEQNPSEPTIIENESNTRTLLNALSYTDKLIRQRDNRIGTIIAVSLATLLFLSIFTCLIVDLAVTHQFTWSRIVVACCIFGGCLFIPPFLSKRRGLLYSLCFLSILIVPFLGVIYNLTAPDTLSKAVLWQMEYPIALLWIAFLWLTLFLIKKVPISPWFKSALVSLFIIPCDLLTNALIDRLFSDEYTIFDLMEYLITVFSLIFIAVICFMIGILRRNKLK